MMDRQTDRIVEVARTWIGTPYHHQMASKGLGCDCLGLVRGVYREIVGKEPEYPPPYSPDWGEIDPQEPLLAAAKRHLVDSGTNDNRAGQVVILRWHDGSAAKHAGILSSSTTLIHAYNGVGVVEVTFAPQWQARLAARFQFPEVI